MPVETLPIDPLLPEICATLRAGTGLVLTAPPGAGKTTRIPPALHRSAIADTGEIVILEPRRLAARMAAVRAAQEISEPVGETVGFTIRFERADSSRTRIRYVTEGVLARGIARDPLLAGIAVLILDEFHERSIQTDLALAYARRLQLTARPDLKILVMSATMDPAPVAEFLGGAPVLESSGRRYDVAVEWEPRDTARPMHEKAAASVTRLVQEQSSGDILVFLPGAAEIRQTAGALAGVAAREGLLVLALHGDLPAAQQSQALEPAAQRKVILATNVAETSITIPGVAAVVDSGLVRAASYSAWTGLPRVELAKASKSSAQQRAGRAGRTGPGKVVRLYTKWDFECRPDRDPPEIRRADLAEPVLALHAAGIEGIADFSWFEAPPQRALDAAEALLKRLGALNGEAGITKVGRRMMRFPLHPRLGRLLIEGERAGIVEQAALAAALLNEKDIRLDARTSLTGSFSGARMPAARAKGSSDLLELMDCFETARAVDFKPDELRRLGLDSRSVAVVDRLHRQLLPLMRRQQRQPMGEECETAMLTALLAAFPDRVAQRRTETSRDLLLAEGGSAELSPGSVVHGGRLLVAIDAEQRRRTPRDADAVLVRLASEIQPEWLVELFPDSIVETRELLWNEPGARVDERIRSSYGNIALEDIVRPAQPGDETGRLLTEAVFRKGLVPIPDAAQAPAFLCRVGLLKQHFPDHGFEGAALEMRSAVEELCRGKRSFAELAHASLVNFLLWRLSRTEQELLRREAPERIALRNGRSVKVNYESDRAPWIQARMQDFFGMSSGPAICGGKLPLTLHLLAPNGRAVQVTQDLAGFWQRHYPAIRRELQRRYPKHAWPETPN
jgi:ATP-dependent helicase HrpB